MLIVIVLGGLLVVREAEFAWADAETYREWNDANGRIIDFYGMYSVPQEAFEQVGWDEPAQAMAEAWCFLNPKISSDAFHTLTDYMDSHDQRTLEQRLKAAWITFYRVVKFSPVEMRCLSMFAVAVGVALIGMCWSRQWRYILYAIPVLVCMSVMLLGLALGGRLPIRAMYPAILPAGSIVLGVLPACFRSLQPDQHKAQNAVMVLGCILSLGLSLWCFSDILAKVPPYSEANDPYKQAIVDLENYALTVPEHLILYDSTMADTDQRVFPSYPNGVPANITFWGGWGMRSPQNVELFERFGINLAEFSPEVFFRGDVFLASADEGKGGTWLVENWIESELGMNVHRSLYCQYGNAYIYRFERPAEENKQGI